jgi:hypothetical protein
MIKPHHALDIASAAARDHQTSPEHRRFKALLGKIDAARARLATWHEQLPRFTEAHAERVQPEIDRLTQARRAWALELSRIALSSSWSKAERKTLAEHLAELCGSLLESGAEPDAEIKAIYNRFSGCDFDREGEQELQAMKRLMETMGGVDLGDEPVDSMDELMQRARAEAMRQREAGGAGPAADGRDDAPWPDQRARGRTKAGAGRAQTAAQRRAEEDARRVTQNVREVYRKLAAALHPDRTAADATPAEREQRLAAMQRANAAYEAGDLLALLALQLQIEQVDIAHAAGVAAAQVKHFNKVLAEQLREIEAEIDERQLAFCASYGYVPERRLDPAKLGVLLQDELRELAAANAELLREQRALRGAPPAARRWLKQRRAEFRMDAELDAMIDGAFGEALQQAFEMPPRKGWQRQR